MKNSEIMPQLSSSSSNQPEPNTSAEESKRESKSKADPSKRKTRMRSKNPIPESAEALEESQVSEAPEIPEASANKPARKAVKRKPPTEKKSIAKTPKPRGPRKKAGNQQEKSEIAQINFTQTIKTEIDDDEDDEDMEEGEIPSSIAAESRTYYSCKLCHKDFSSAFILCLHLQIHQKVANTMMLEEQSSTVANEESENGAAVKSEKIDNVDESADTVAEEDDEDEPGLVKVENNCQPSGLINKNFVENLKRNLSLAMARNNL